VVGERAAAGAVARGRAHAQPYGGRPEPHGEGRRGGTHLSVKQKLQKLVVRKGEGSKAREPEGVEQVASCMY
jgi:hypothetical protein